LTKFDNVSQVLIQYVYDIDNPTTYGSDNNRLMYYLTWDTSGQQSVLISTKYYTWDSEGRADRVITELETAVGHYTADRFVYDRAGRVNYILGESWDQDDCNTQNYTVTYAREFRYDSARGRYLDRKLDPTKLTPNGSVSDLVSLSDTWTDYDGDTTYGDFTISGNTATNTRATEPGLAKQDPWGQSTAVDYYHTDQIGTTRLTSDDQGAASATYTYTAFGERLDSGMYQRYAYAGAYGYETADYPSSNPTPYLHVGARYYDPATGRFLQRDPAGIKGGLNVYAYVFNAPTYQIDPLGLCTDVGKVVAHGVGGTAGSAAGAAVGITILIVLDVALGGVPGIIVICAFAGGGGAVGYDAGGDAYDYINGELSSPSGGIGLDDYFVPRNDTRRCHPFPEEHPGRVPDPSTQWPMPVAPRRFHMPALP